jgi:glycosyltransferase involved in cell wall biosynthesis
LGLEVRNIYFSLLNGFSVRRAAHVIAVSETVRDEIVAKDGIAAEKISVVPLALSEFLPPPKQAHLTDIGVPEPFFLYVGAWEPYKNIDKILAGLARLRIKYGSDARLVILGLNVHGYGEALADHARALGVYEAVHFVGPTPHAELTTWYCKATALVLLSACEAFPLTPFEAMINDLPVIGAHDGAVAEIIGDGGLLVDPADAAAVAAAMHRALTDCELAEQLAEQGRRRAGQYSWARTASEITALLRTYQQSP